MQPAAVLSVLVVANTKQAQAGLMRFQGQLRTTEGRAASLGNTMKSALKVGAFGAGAALGYSVKKAADFEQQLDSLGSVSAASGREMEKFRKQAMKAGADTKFSALDAAVAQTELAKGGLSVRNIMRGGLRSALALAAAGEMDLGEAAATTANALNLFGLEGKSSMKVADALAKAANATTADVTDFAMALRQSGGVAKTAGLSFTETVLALEALANAGTKNSDAGTSLKAALLQLIGPTAKQRELQEKLGLEFINSEGSMKSMTQISTMLRGSLGKMGDAQRAATLKVLAGTDGVRTLTALYDAGPEKLDRWRTGLQKSGTAAEVAARKQDNLKGKLENLQGSVETIAIAFGSKLLPALTDAAEKVTDVLNDKQLSGTEKFDKLGEMAAEAIGKAGPVIGAAAAKVALIGVRGFFNAFRESPLWLKLITVGFLASKLGFVGLFRKSGVQAGAAFGSGFAAGAAPAMAAAAATQRKTAGMGVVAGGGRGAPASQAGSKAYGMGAVAAGVKSQASKIAPGIRAIGKGVLGLNLMLGIVDAVTAKDISFGDRFQTAFSSATLGLIPSPKTFSEKLNSSIKGALQQGSPKFDGFLSGLDEGLDDKGKAIIAKLKKVREVGVQLFGPDTKLRLDVWTDPAKAIRNLDALSINFSAMRNDTIGTVKELRTVTERNMKLIAETMGSNSRSGKNALRENMGLALAQIERLRDRGVVTTRTAMKEIARLLADRSAAGKNALKGNFDGIRNAIRDTMGRGEKITARGMDVIRDLFVKELRMYGLSPKQALAGANLRTGEVRGGTRRQDFQRGGPINTGAASGDTVPAMLERGEYVMNRKAVQKVGKQNLDRVNFAAAPRFQKGGGVGGMVAAANRLDKAQFPYLWGGGHQGSPAPFGPMDCSGAVSYVLQHGGVQIPTMVSGALAGAGQPGPGKVTVFADPGHTFMRIGKRYFGTSRSNPGGGAGWFPDPGSSYKSRFTQRHFAAAGKVGGGGMGNVGRLIVGGTESPLKDMVQGALDKTRRGANKKLGDLAATAIGSGDAGDPGPFGGNYNGPLNRNFGKGSNVTIGFNQAAMLAEKVGLPGVTYAEIAIGESGLRPGAVSSDGGFGLWQMTPRVQSAETVAKWEAIGSYFNPWNNARMAKVLAGSGTGVSNYFGTGSVTDFNKHYDGPMKGLKKGGMVGYAGDSLGVGTIGPLRALLDRKVQGHPSSGKSSSWGVGQLVKGAAQHVFDFGTNDATAGAIKASINRVDSKTGKKPIHVMTVNGTPAGGQSAALKNKAIRSAAHGDVNLVDWAAKHKGQLDSLGHGAYPERARLIAASIKRVKDGGEGMQAEFTEKPHWATPFLPGQSVPLQALLADTTRNLRGAKRGQLKKLLSRMRKRLPEVEVPDQLKKQIGLLSTAQEMYGERADNAGTLTTEAVDANGDPILDAQNRQVINWGMFAGKTEPQWVQDQLGALLSLRNKLIEAHAISTKRLAMLKKLIAQVEGQMKRIAKAVADAKEKVKDLEGKLEHGKDVLKNLRKKLKQAKKDKKPKKEIAALERKVSDTEGQQKMRKQRVSELERFQKTRKKDYGVLKDKLLPWFTGRKTTMQEFMDTDVVDSLNSTQGAGMPMTRFEQLPPLGSANGLGGNIFAAQSRWAELTKPGPIVDRASAAGDSESVELWKQLTREANQRTAVSQRQYDILKNFDATSGAQFMGAFAKGGVALVGERGPELAHLPSGTRVHSAADTASLVGPKVSVHIYEGEGRAEVFIDDRKIDAAVERITRRQARTAGRGLPGRGGGGF